MAESPVCAHCQSPLDFATTVHLWDGKDYCRMCVEDACEGMADYAAAHPVLQETRPFSLTAFLWIAAITTLLFVLIPCTLVYLAAADRSEQETRAALILVGSVFGFLAVLIFLMIWVIETKQRETVRVDNGIVTILPPIREVRSFRCYGSVDEADMRHRASPLSECRWHLQRFGPSLGTPMPKVPIVCLLVREPFLGMGSFFHSKYCGYTPKMRAIWEGFLTLAGVPTRVGLWQALCRSLGKVDNESHGGAVGDDSA